MPYIVDNPRRVTEITTGMHDKVPSYKSRYPEGLDLKPGSDLHDKLVTELMIRARQSYTHMAPRYSSWNKIDRTLTAFINVDDAEAEVQDIDERRPVSVVVPYTYAMMESVLTYMTMAFFQNPIFRYGGTGPEDTLGAMMMEHVVGQQTMRAKARVQLHTFFRDSLSYGFGAVTPVWEKHYGRRRKRLNQVVGIPELGEQFPGEASVLEDYLKFEGNVLYNIDPYHILPDPNRPIHEFQKGEYFGWYEEDNYINLVNDAYDDDNLFNVKYLELVQLRSSTLEVSQDQRNQKSGMSEDSGHTHSTRPVGLVHMYVKLIPKEWGLSKEERPEVWVFLIGNDAILLRANRLELDHGMFPAVVAAPDTDGYALTPQSRLEILYGLQHVTDFLFNSHIANVRKAVNDTIVYDPSVINSRDLKDPKAGKLIRLRRPAWGKNINEFIQQLDINDVTRANITDAQWVMQIMQNISAASDPMMGVVRQGGPERLGGGEFASTQQGMMSRLKRIAEMVSAQGMYDLAYLYASQTQQLMSEETYVKLSGEWEQRLRDDFGVAASNNRLKVSPFDLLVNYDIDFFDGSLPGGNNLDTYVELYKIIAQDEQLRQQYDTFRMFSFIAKQAGAKNTEEFRRVTNNTIPQLMPDEQVVQQVERGNLIPLPGVAA